MAINKCGLQPMLDAVLSVANQEQCAFFPPTVYQNIYNAVSSYLLSEIAEIFPTNQRYKDVVKPFLRTKVQRVVDGYVTIPEESRNFLTAAINAKSDFSAQCDENVPQVVLEQQFKDSVAKSKCLSRPVLIVEQSEWDDLTTHPYNYPTYKEPIGCFFDSKLKVCPFDITAVEIRYLINEETYVYGYTTLPDGTYINDPSTTVETQWQTNAFKFFFKGVNTLYGIYTRDSEFRDFSMELKKVGLL